MSIREHIVTALILLISFVSQSGQCESIVDSFEASFPTGRLLEEVIHVDNEDVFVDRIAKDNRYIHKFSPATRNAIQELLFNNKGLFSLGSEDSLDPTQAQMLHACMFQAQPNTSGTAWLELPRVYSRVEYKRLLLSDSAFNFEVAQLYLFHPDPEMARNALFVFNMFLINATNEGRSVDVPPATWRRFFILSAIEDREYDNLVLGINAHEKSQQVPLIRSFLLSHGEDDGVKKFLRTASSIGFLQTATRAAVEELLSEDAGQLPDSRRSVLESGLRMIERPSLPD